MHPWSVARDDLTFGTSAGLDLVDVVGSIVGIIRGIHCIELAIVRCTVAMTELDSGRDAYLECPAPAAPRSQLPSFRLKQGEEK